MPARLQLQLPLIPDPSQRAGDFLDSSFSQLRLRKMQVRVNGVYQRRQRLSPFQNNFTLILGLHPSNLSVSTSWSNLARLWCLKTPYVYMRFEKHSLMAKFPYQKYSLHDRWASLNGGDKSTICEQLKEIVASLRKLEQALRTPSLVASLTSQPLHDYVLEDMPWGGPFRSVTDFNDWFSSLPQHRFPDVPKYRDPYRDYLPDTGDIKFTHGDLHRGNVMISPTTGPPRVLTIVDWTHAGWYPEYWEYCKALYTAHYDWRTVYIPSFLTPHETEFAVFGEYVLQMGAI
ncbi:hypothetical protein AJ79_05923 [Helicocarpus griseus UAMH5409]|uniref:Aminoglycoside phosphotransferase domain-containing protein n=1 Tax=Helicocarpus griseus UAMH5409 TaxID=1447875 RepID=A0A2B7XJ55_9EURO|nr:hypothetical protein AJ79_05923 [Helicocarpus griseus UAMH5409]